MVNKLLNPNQSGDSCINQLVSITHEIYASFDADPSLEVTGVFLDISNRVSIDRVWNEGLIYKMKSMGIKGDLLALIEYFYLKDNKELRGGYKGGAAGVPRHSFFFV